jgi:hypothetical protein
MLEISLVKSDHQAEDSVLAGASGHWIIEDSIMLPNINTGVNIQLDPIETVPLSPTSPTKTEGRNTTIPDTSRIIPGASSENSYR